MAAFVLLLLRLFAFSGADIEPVSIFSLIKKENVDFLGGLDIS